MMVLQTIVIRIGGLAFGIVGVHVLDGGRGVRAVHRARQLRGLRAPAHRPARCSSSLWCLALLVRGALPPARDGALLGACAARDVPRTSTRPSIPSTSPCFGCLLLVIGAGGRALGRDAAAALSRAATRGRRSRVAGRTPVQREHDRLAARRADRRLRAAVLARPAPRLPDRGRRARARGGDRHAAPGSADALRGRGGAAAGRRSCAIAAAARVARRRTSSAGTFRERQPAPWTFGGPSVLYAAAQRAVLVPRRRSEHLGRDPGRSAPANAARRAASSSTENPTATPRATTPRRRLLALVPALFAERAEHAFVIGFGTGVTAGNARASSKRCRA